MCRFGILENFCYLYVTIDGRAYRTRRVQHYNRAWNDVPDGCHAGYSSDDKKKEVPLSEDRTQDPEPL